MSRLRPTSWLSHYYYGRYGLGYPYYTSPYFGGYPWHGLGPLRIVPYLSPVPTLFVAAPSGKYSDTMAELDWADMKLTGSADDGFLCENAHEANKVISEFLLQKWAHHPSIQIIFSGVSSDKDNVWEFKDGSIMPFSQLGCTVMERKSPLTLEIFSTSPNTSKWNTKVSDFNRKSARNRIVLTSPDSFKWPSALRGWGYPYHYGLGYPYYGLGPLSARFRDLELARVPSSPISSIRASPVPTPEPAASALTAAEKSAGEAEAAAAYVADLAKQAKEHLDSAKALAAKAKAEKQAEADRKAKLEALKKEDEIRIMREKAVAAARAHAEAAYKAEQEARAAALARAEQERMEAIRKAEELRAAQQAAAAAAAAKAAAEARAAEEARLAALRAEEERRAADAALALKLAEDRARADEAARLEALAAAERARLASIARFPYYKYHYAGMFPYGMGYGYPPLAPVVVA